MKGFILILLCLWFWLINPANILAEVVEETTNSTNLTIVEPKEKPIKTYYLNVLGQTRSELAIDPPATKIDVISQSGDTILRCGDEQNIYSCSPGRRLELEYDIATPVVKFWGENLSDIQVRLQIEVYSY